MFDCPFQILARVRGSGIEHGVDDVDERDLRDDGLETTADAY